MHYCVANMPGAVPRTSTYALTNATSRYVLDLANKGWRQALRDDPELRKGLNVACGKVAHPAIAELVRLPTRNPLTDCLHSPRNYRLQYRES